MQVARLPEAVNPNGVKLDIRGGEFFQARTQDLVYLRRLQPTHRSFHIPHLRL